MFRRHNARGKKRTREHVIADLSINFVERMILLQGHTAERWYHDYGIDLAIQYVPVRIERSHLRYWLGQPLPVILIVYDSQNEIAYWLSIHAAFGGTNRFRAATGSETLTVRIPVAQKLDGDAIQRYRQMRQAVMDEFEEWRDTL